MNITREDILKAIAEAAGGPVAAGEGATGPEILEALGGGRDRGYRAIRKLLQDGALEIVVVRRPGMDGRLCTVRGYRPVQTKSPPK